MKRPWVWRVGVAALALVVIALAAGAIGARDAVARPAVPTGFQQRADRDVQIRVWRQALAADSTSAIALAQLAALHLQRGREGGSFEDYITAETFARRSLASRTRRNGRAASTLVAILLAQHRFVDARQEAEALVVREPDVPAYRAALGEAAMELGDDALAARMFTSVWADRGSLTIAARLARWFELNGHVRQARTLLTTARRAAARRRDVPRETQAWFALRLADLELRAGRITAAGAALKDGLAIEPGDPRLHAAMARVAMAHRRYDDAIRWGESAIAEQLDPTTLGVIAEAYAAKGDTIKAADYARTLDIAVSQQPGAYHRAWSLHLLDHGLRVPDVLAKARAELQTRRDVYGWDVYAWALYRAGLRDSARAAMREALRLHTPDPLLERHAAAIGVPFPHAAGA